MELKAEVRKVWPGMELSEELGHGSYGQVYSVEWRGTAYALKVAPLRLTDAEHKALPPVLYISDEHSYS